MLVVPVHRLPDHILSLGLELLDGLFAPSPTASGTAFMTAYLASPPSATPHFLREVTWWRLVAVPLAVLAWLWGVLGSMCHLLPRPWGVLASLLPRPWGVPASLGGHPLLWWASLAVGQILTMGSRPRATFILFWASLHLWAALAPTRVSPVWTWGASGFPSLVFLDKEWGVLVSPQRHPFCMGGILVDGRIRTKGSHPPLDPILPRVLLALWLLLAPFAALPFLLWWRFPRFIHPVPAPPFLPRFLFRVIPGIIRLGVLLSAVFWGGALPPRLPAHVVAPLAVRLRQATPFLPRYVIGVLRVRSGMSLIGRSQRRMTFLFLRSRFLRTNLFCVPSSRVRII